jgi:hypothetical protein
MPAPDCVSVSTTSEGDDEPDDAAHSKKGPELPDASYTFSPDPDMSGMPDLKHKANRNHNKPIIHPLRLVNAF